MSSLESQVKQAKKTQSELAKIHPYLFKEYNDYLIAKSKLRAAIKQYVEAKRRWYNTREGI